MSRTTLLRRISTCLALMLVSFPALAANGGLPQLNSDTFASQIFWLLVAFALMYVFLKKFAVKPIAMVQDDRTAKINTDLDKAATAKAEADRLVADYELKLAQAHANAKTEVSRVVGTAKAEAVKAETSQAQAIADRGSQAESRIAAARAKAMTELTAEAHELTRLLSQKVAGFTPKPEVVSRAVAQATDATSTSAEAA